MNQADPRMDEFARRRSARPTAGTDRLSVLVVLFLIGLVFPLMIYIGPLRLSVYRIVLLLYLIPCLGLWAAGRAGPIRLADVCMILIGLWSAVSYTVLHDVSVGIESGGIHITETLGAYFLGRCFIRGPEAFHRMAVVLFWIIIGLLPFLINETLTGRSMILALADSLGSTYANADTDPRLGFERAQGPFQHPILLGVFCGTVVSLTYFVVARSRRFVTRVLSTLAVVLATFCGLSSGPLAAIALQLVVIGWDGVFKRHQNRWWWFGGLFALCYVVVDLISNRSPLRVLMSYAALNASTAYGRIYQFELGWADVMKHPVFGTGLYGDSWVRPEWMSATIDIFWLRQTMAHGLPMGALYLLAFFAIFGAVTWRRLSDSRLRDYRMGYLGCLVGLFMTGWAVHFWNEPYVLLMFLMGSGIWLLDHDETPPASPPSGKPARRRTVLG